MDGIERSAQIADEVVSELKGMFLDPSSRQGRYDRRSGREIKYALRWAQRIADRIRAQRGVDLQEQATPSKHVFNEASSLLREVRPLIAQAGASHWKSTMLQRIDAILLGKVEF